ncbi:MAG TPA: phenylalanine--tRNA ligase subunit beta [Anaerolineae bacterium]|nr:phenylalanine--tRNA ligase subunit beta [Anaerolineae bacterium]
MRVPVSWLREYINLPIPVEQLAEKLTLAGLEVAEIDYIWERDKVFVGEVLKVEPHPNADRLTLATVEYGAGAPKTVVTGAPNLKVGDQGIKVPFAVVGARLIDGHAEGRKLATLKPGKIRGVLSDGMVLSEKELGLSDDHTGIIILPEDAPVGMPLADYLGDIILDLDMTPNLARDFAVIGVAREVAALTGQVFKSPEPVMQADSDPPADRLVNLEIADPDLCSRYSATIIRGVNIAPSPGWLARRITLAGMRPISNIVDITNYVMWEWGQPLHAFDYDKLVERARQTGHDVPTIIVRRARPGETMTTLDNIHRTLTPDMLLITDTAGPIAIAGVMGGAETEVTGSTRNVLLEAANFNFINIRRTSAALKLPSEAASRFGRGIHPALTVPAAIRATELMRQFAGGNIARGVADTYPVPAPTVVVDLTTAEVKRILGLELSPDEISRILTAMEFACETIGEGALRVTTPPHRLDIEGPHDLIEEVARIYGYDRIPRTAMQDEMPPQRGNPDLDLEELARDALVDAGLQEVVTHSMTTPAREAKVLPPGTRADDRPYVELANPISAERTHMRHTLLASLLDTAASNLRHHASVSIFEINRVYLVSEDGPLPDEPRRLAIVMTGPREPETWQGGDTAPMDFYDLKGVVEAVAGALHLADVRYEPGDHPSYQPGRAAKLLIGDQVVGSFGEIHPLVREAFDLSAQQTQPVMAAELDYETLVRHARQMFRVGDVPRYPAVTEDLAVIVNDSVPAETVRAAIAASGGELLRSVQVFDVFKGEQIGPGKKSLAWRLTYQSDDRTLTDAEVAGLRAAIVRRLQDQLDAVLRG